MATLAFYRQARVDGGVRSGIEVEGSGVLEHYKPGSDEFDPALLWYVDVVVEGARLPHAAEDVRAWFRSNSKTLRDYLSQAATELGPGFDVECRPYSKSFSGPGRGVRTRIVVSAAHRLVAREVAELIERLADSWDDALLALAPLANV